MHAVSRAAGALAVTTTVLVAGVEAAAADPPRGFPVTVVCDNGETYQAVVSGNGEFTPAHILGATGILVPTSFGETVNTVTDASGVVVDRSVDPASSKGGAAGRSRATSTSCTFTASGTFEDPDLGTLTFSVAGTVSGFVTPVR